MGTKLAVQDGKWVMSRLKACELLSNEAANPPETFLDEAEIERVLSGKTIIHEGESAECFFLVRGGMFGVWVTTSQGPRRLATLDEGDIFGEVAILGDGVRNADVIAESNAWVVKMPAHLLKDLCEQSLNGRDHLSRAAARRIGSRAFGVEPTSAS
jgi:CRP-like cAMP-binding protein